MPSPIKPLILIVIVILLGITGIFLHNRNLLSPSIDNNQITDANQDLSILQAIVLDSETQEPIANAIVYLGTGSWQCLSDIEGKCRIKNFSWGDYGLGTYKKGYDRFVNPGHFEKGLNNLTIKLHKQPIAPKSFQVEGTIIEVVTAKGTLSENHYFKIKEINGTEEYLFNPAGQNEPFNSVNKKVCITGYKELGSVGWQADQVMGIYVEKIE